MSIAIIGISKTLIESGLNQTLIQKKETNLEDFTVVFTYNLVLSVFLYLIIYYSANAIRDFYNQDVIGNIIKVLSLIIIIESFSLIQRASLTKAIRFDLIAKIDIFSTIVSGCIGICLALLGFGVWSLAFKQLIQSIMATGLYWIFNPIKICLSFSWWPFKTLFRFDQKFLLLIK